VGRLALAVSVICGARLLDQDATTGRLTMRSSTIYGLISSVIISLRRQPVNAIWRTISTVVVYISSSAAARIIALVFGTRTPTTGACEHCPLACGCHGLVAMYEKSNA
jgi:hypothetical protein